MYKVIFHNLNENITPFETLELAQAWLDKQLAKPRYLGLKASYEMLSSEVTNEDVESVYDKEISPARIENSYAKDENGNNIFDENNEPIIEASYDIPAVTESRSIIRAEYTYEIKDLTADVAKEKALKDAYDSMVNDIYTEMKVVFGTSNDASASAFASTWEAMKNRPLNYIDIDLGFATELEVTTYANEKLALADAYAIFRIKRIAQYDAEKELIMNS